jgi:epoxyqueuosine reductase
MKTTDELSMVTAEAVKRRASAEGFDLCGIAPAAALPELEYLLTWLKNGYAGEMQYMHRSAARRGDVRNILPAARSIIVLGTVYNVSRPYSTENADPRQAGIARYAWGDDYHDVISRRMSNLLRWLIDQAGPGFEGRAYVDTGPVQERVYARHAGLGWIAKNTCVINPDLGSWLFLSEIICNLPLAPDAPALDQCGTCTLCLDACPTGALVEPYVLDSNRCLSYLTIELKESIPEHLRTAVGEHAYGCDICQEVCPWNLAPGTAASQDKEWLPRAGLDGVRLLDLWRKTDAELRSLLKGSAMKRAGVRRFRRNLAVAIGNSRDGDAVESLRSCEEVTAQDPLVQHHVEWAIEKLEGGHGGEATIHEGVDRSGSGSAGPRSDSR